MADTIDMSLDDIIKKNRKSGGGRGKGRVGRVGGRGARAGAAAVAGAARGKRRPFRGSGRGGGRISRGSVKSPYRRGNANNAWTHDLFDTPKRGGVMREVGISAKLVVSNLDFGVVDSDISELFSEFGKLKTAAVHYDRSGRSLGTADVVFERRSDAVKAMKQYNNVPLDGRPMNIQMAADELAVARSPAISRPAGLNALRRSSGGRVDKFNRRPRGVGNVRGARRDAGKPSQRGGRPGGRGGRGGARGGGRGAKRPIPSREDLDKELDSYLSSR